MSDGKQKNLQVALLPRTATVRLSSREITKADLIRANALLMTLNDADSFLFGPGDLRFSPAARPSAILVLDQQMRRSNLAFLCAFVQLSRRRRRGAVMLRHVGFQLLRVRLRGGLPSRLFGGRVEIVREVFRIGVAHFPVSGKTCVRLFGIIFPLSVSYVTAGNTYTSVGNENFALTMTRFYDD